MSEVFSTPVLALDTSLGGCVVGVMLPKEEAFFQKILKTDRDQAAKLVPIIEDVLKEAGTSFKDIGLIVTTKGPGSFTGLRIGMTTAKTLGLSLNVPVQGVDTLCAMIKSCWQADESSGYLCVLETKRADFYAGFADKNMGREGASFSGSREEILKQCEGQKRHLCGDATDRFLAGEGGDELFVSVTKRDLLCPLALCQLGVAEYLAQGNDHETLEPLYLRGADVSQSKKPQREIKDFIQS